jgi:signal peptidase I
MTSTLRRAVGLTVLTALVAVWAVTLRPQPLGGPALFVAVRGSSMLPTYESGDLVVIESAAHYAVGEVVAYRVPSGEVGAGKVVIHRIVGGNARDGFILKGDHNTASDPWSPRQADIAGAAALRLPGGGRIISLVRQPVILAGLAASIVVALVVARPTPPRRVPTTTPRRRRPRPRAPAPSGVDH